MKKIIVFFILVLCFSVSILADIDTDLRMQYRFENNYVDSIGTMNLTANGTGNAFSSTTKYEENFSIFFDGNGWANKILPQSFVTGNGSYSGFCWINVSNIPARRQIFGFGNETAGQFNFFALTNTTGNIQLELGQFGIETDTSNVINPVMNEWNFVGVTYNNTLRESNFYLNGQNVGSESFAGANNIGTQKFIIGAGFGASNRFVGYIDYCNFYNRTLNNEDVEQLYRSINNITGIDIVALEFYNETPIQDFNVTFTNGSFFSSNSSNSIFANFTTGTYTFTARSNGYFPIQRTVNLENYTLEYLLFQQIGLLNVTFRSVSNGQLITEQINVSVESLSTQSNYNTTTGSIFLTNLEENGGYRIIATSENYTTGFYDINYTSSVGPEITLYLFSNNTDTITFGVQSTSGVFIPDATILIESFINGSYNVVGQKNTDVTGTAQFGLILGQSYRITLSKSLYHTQVFILELNDLEYTFVMEELSQVNFSGPSSGILYNYTPSNLTLNPTIQTFTLNVNPTNETLTVFGITIRNGSSLIGQNTSNVASGGTVYLTVDLSAYNNTKIRVSYFFQKDGESIFVEPVIYDILSQQNVSGSLNEVRSWSSSQPIQYRLFIWVLLLVFFLIVLWRIIPEVQKNAIVSISASVVVAYFLALDIILIVGILAVIGISYFGRSYGGLEV